MATPGPVLMISAACLAEELGDHFRLAIGIRRAIGRQQRGKAVFQLPVSSGLAGMGPQEVTQVDVIAMRLAIRHNHIPVNHPGHRGS